jgi:hypothetical protein
VKTDRFTSELNDYFLTTVDVPRIKVGTQQEIESLINEEAQLLAKFLRGERPTWIPRVAELK